MEVLISSIIGGVQYAGLGESPINVIVKLLGGLLGYAGGMAIVSAIPGVQSVAEVNENINYVKHDVPIDLWKELNEAGLIQDKSHLVSSP